MCYAVHYTLKLSSTILVTAKSLKDNETHEKHSFHQFLLHTRTTDVTDKNIIKAFVCPGIIQRSQGIHDNGTYHIWHFNSFFLSLLFAQNTAQNSEMTTMEHQIRQQ
jgi:hypothetical protein